MKQSLWISDSPAPEFTRLNGECRVEAGIVGAGITGTTCAYLLAKEGVRVALLDAFSPGTGDTGNSTGNLYVPVSEFYRNIAAMHGAGCVKMLTESRARAVGLVELIVKENGINCEFQRVPWHLCAAEEDGRILIDEEFAALKEAEVDVLSDTGSSAPFDVLQELTLGGQAQLNPYRYVSKLASIVRSMGCEVYSNSRVMDIEYGSPHKLKTEHGTVICDHLFHATHTPKGFHISQAFLGPYREYGLAARLKSDLPAPGIYWRIGKEHHSIRTYKNENGAFLVIVGEMHKVGQDEDTNRRHKSLEAFAREYFAVEEVTHRWSAQQYRSSDFLPFIGEATHEKMYIATGYAADGLTYGTAAAIVISDLISKRGSSWQNLYQPLRIKPALSARMLSENINVAGCYLKDYLTKGEAAGIEEVSTGEGKLVTVDGQKLCLYRDEEGKKHFLSPICPHLKCIVHFNKAEKTWDCPCHGSRFAGTGEILQGPALHSLKKVDVKE